MSVHDHCVSLEVWMSVHDHCVSLEFGCLFMITVLAWSLDVCS